jgi:lysophospholipase L1-like esterase
MPIGSATWRSTGERRVADHPGRSTIIGRPSSLSGAALAIVIALAACVADPDPTASPFPTAEPPTPTPTPLVTPTPRPSPTPTITRAPGSGGGVYLALGDSVTFGVGAPQPRRQGYPALVAEQLGADGAPDIEEVLVFAVPGETASGFLERRTDAVEAAIAELGERVELVTIGLGANEILRIRRHPACAEDRGAPECQRIATDAAESAAAALDGVVRRVDDALREAGSDAPIFLLAYYNPDVEPVAVTAIVGADGVVACDPDDPAPGLNDRIACIAERRGTGLVDLYAAFLGREQELTGFGRGDVHPNAAGYAVIAEAIVAEVVAAFDDDPEAGFRTGVRIG